MADVNRSVEQAPSWPRLAITDGRLRREPASTTRAVDVSLSAIAAQAVELFTGDDQVRLRACYAPGCVLYFVKDHPRRNGVHSLRQPGTGSTALPTAPHRA